MSRWLPLIVAVVLGIFAFQIYQTLKTTDKSYEKMSSVIDQCLVNSNLFYADMYESTCHELQGKGQCTLDASREAGLKEARDAVANKCVSEN